MTAFAACAMCARRSWRFAPLLLVLTLCLAVGGSGLTSVQAQDTQAVTGSSYLTDHREESFAMAVAYAFTGSWPAY